jgi:hypothetical protein
VKSEYEKHALKEHPASLPEDLQVEPAISTGGVETLKDITIVRVSDISIYRHCACVETLKDITILRVSDISIYRHCACVETLKDITIVRVSDISTYLPTLRMRGNTQGYHYC